MAKQAAEILLQIVRALAAGQVARDQSDQELLDRYVRQHDEAAFTALMERHGSLVLGVCRRALQDEHAAEDVFQATFLVLARNAGSIRKRRSLSGWLHGVALRLSRKATAAATRARRDAARPAPEPPHGPAAEASWSEVRQILDEEMGRLPERYRLPLILCHLEGRTRDEAAAAMGCTPGQLKGLLERGRERLRTRLIRRGLAPASVGSILLTETALATPVPPLLAVATLRFALDLGAVQCLRSCGVSASVRALLEGGFPMVGARKLLVVLVFTLVAGVGGLGMLGEPRTGPAAHARAGDEQPRKGMPVVDKTKVDRVDDETAVKAHIKALRDANCVTRAAAAEALRRIVAKYRSGTVYLSKKDGGEAAWQAKVNQVNPGMVKAEVLKIVPSFAEVPEISENGSGNSHIVSYRLDYHWIVTVTYRNPDKVIERPVLTRRALQVYVGPPKDFSGTWITWHVNGQKGHETHYKNGKYHGALTCYHDNGTKNYEQHYVNHESHGTDTGWDPTGKLSYAGQYRHGKQDGTWTHWYRNGGKHSEANYANGKYHGRQTDWHENGQIHLVTDYLDGVKHGLEGNWDTSGDVQYERRFVNGVIVD